MWSSINSVNCREDRRGKKSPNSGFMIGIEIEFGDQDGNSVPATNEVPFELMYARLIGTKEELIHVVKQFHIRNHQDIVVSRSDLMNWYVARKYKNDGCI